MLNIMLVCCAGMSTSLLVTKMNEAAREKGIEANIFAVAETEVRKITAEVDVVLLGPQVRFLLTGIKKIMEPKGIVVDVINGMDYGTMRGDKVLEHALRLVKVAEGL